MALRRVPLLTLAALLTLATLGPPAASQAPPSTGLAAYAQLSDGASVLVAGARLPEDGYVVVHADAGGEPGGILGASALLEVGGHVGVGVEVALDELEGNVTTLWAMLHQDDGDGRFRAQDDPPVTRGGAPVVSSFPVKIAEGPGATAASHQATWPAGLVVETAWVPHDGFVVLHRDDGGAPGEPVASTSLLAGGRYEDLPLPVGRDDLPRDAVDLPVWLVVHGSDGDGAFEPANDSVVRAAGEPVGSPMRVTTVVPDLRVGDQTTDGTHVTVRRAALHVAGWVAIYPEERGGGLDEGSPLGLATLRPGVAEDAELRLADPFFQGRESLFVRLHLDDPTDGRFTPAEGDPVVTVDGSELVRRFTWSHTSYEPPRTSTPGPGLGLALLAAGLAALVLAAGPPRERR